jgi:RimJ/RimL family protein N-acetyltransferase
VNDDLTMRPISGADEIDLFCRFPYVLNDELRDDLDAGRRHAEFLWVALRGEQLVARVGWWARQRDAAPLLLDIFDFDADAIDVAVELLETAISATIPDRTAMPQYLRMLDAGWHDDPVASHAVRNRMAALQRLGARPLVERLRLEWRAGTPIAPPSRRLLFKPATDRDELLGLLTLTLEGTLDAHSRRDLTSRSAPEVALEQLDGEFPGYLGPPEWWRIASLSNGEPVGFVVPTRNSYRAIIAYIGVVPAHRGHGYIDDLLAEGTRILAAQDVPRIGAATDVGNVPMANAFARGGYAVTGRQIDMVWD